MNSFEGVVTELRNQPKRWLVTADSFAKQGDYDLSLMKLDASGAVTWSKSYGGTAFDGGFHGGIDVIVSY